jgi:hypothetical protein
MVHDMTQEQTVKASVFDKPPLSMSRQDRNERLYETLLRMELYVVPVPDNNRDIDHFKVSSGIPS